MRIIVEGLTTKSKLRVLICEYTRVLKDMRYIYADYIFLGEKRA